METTNYIRNVYEKVKKQGSRLFLKRRIGFLRFWVSITFAQRCYFLATSMLLIQLLLNIESGLFEAIMFGFALVGIVSETWPKFMVLWNSLPGKAVILFVYAIIANFALASASGMVNSITGVSASALPYSHNFALILMVPSWFFVTTLMALVGGMLVIFVYLFFLLLLKPFGVQRLWHQPGYRFVLSTAVARFVWTLGVALQLGILAGQVGLLSEFSSDSANPLITIEETENKRENSESQLTEEQAEDVSELERDLTTLLTNAKQKSVDYKKAQRQALANFIYEFEADSRSRCAHPEGTRVIELNDYEILQIEKTAETAEGFVYTVEPCRSAAIGLSINP
ncbi:MULTISPECIES: hypothetical protein [Alteromonas]|jgi:hypothetical protein|uniref:hypothetical protein n=1 Tax=Alteromonas TaxID=226 RepID=UPI000AD8DEFC|nr:MULTISPECIES: hypothetical protein [Alteromonas]CAI2389447.1 hypothetical protein ALT831_01382 [Alteromonas macleodii]CAI3944884.1 hypothetical protein ALTBGP9_01312 [Alteromonas macleodii]CAI3945858.1 hypothetical protein ALTBGP14_01382 [Alteromonas macleodii]CAI3945928.1 hypothetical protein ALTBGP6_01382 [Alteromonas macleodii]VTO39043.1 hypothetical protein ALTBGP6_01382 [Alteromonas macleodii]|tara:strand:- start:557 stop:1576 length:1020 start_codon:yes stop_codon:yes gene_type:complete